MRDGLISRSGPTRKTDDLAPLCLDQPAKIPRHILFYQIGVQPATYSPNTLPLLEDVCDERWSPADTSAPACPHGGSDPLCSAPPNRYDIGNLRDLGSLPSTLSFFYHAPSSPLMHQHVIHELHKLLLIQN